MASTYDSNIGMQYGYTTVPHLARVDITGPYKATGPGDTPSRQRIFVCHPSASADEIPCARQIVSNLVRRAFRRAPADADLESLLSFYQQERSKTGSFDAGIEMALRRILADPEFVFRFEPPPTAAPPNAPYRISDTELASRLSFFLWSSIPDDELLNLAIQNKLHEPAVLEQQTRRMLADQRARALVTNFAGQWLYLRDLKSANPDSREFPDFDDNLRQAFQRETEMLFESILREDRSVLDLLDADYTFVNERLAKHYGIAGIYGPDFRRVPVPSDARRGSAGTRKHAAGHLQRQSHVSGAAGQVDSGESAGQPASPAAAQCAAAQGKFGWRRRHFRSRAHGGASLQSGVRRMP